jgi:murein peptide amidase A
LLAEVRELGLEEWGRSGEGRIICGAVIGALTPALSRGRERGRVLVVGGVHGDEPSSVEAVVALIRRLRAGGTSSDELVVVPALNPDGLARGAKNNARDVDLNRNFAARNWSAAHEPGYFPGAAPLSEPETRLLADLVEAHGVRAVVAVHAPFACVNFDGPAAAAIWAEDVARASGWPARADIGYPTPGSLGSWLGVDRGLPILTLELPPGPHAAFGRQAAAALDEAVRPRGPL